MERMFETFATFLLEELGQVIREWSVRFQKLEHEDSPEVELHVNQSTCIFHLRLPSPEYIEAMLGDLLEGQNRLEKRGSSKCSILLLTVVAIMKMAIDITIITLQDFLKLARDSQQVESIEPAAMPEVLSEGRPSDVDLLNR